MKYLIDGSNICHWGGVKSSREQFSLAPLFSLCFSLKRRGWDFLCLFDASARDLSRKIRNGDFYEDILETFPNHFSEIPDGIEADVFLLQQVDGSDLKIITNDRFRDHKENFPNVLADESLHLIKGKIISGRLVIPSLHINDEMSEDPWIQLRGFLCSDVVTIKASNGLYVSAELETDTRLVANREEAKAWEQFTRIHFFKDKFALQASNGNFIGPEQRMGGRLFANRPICGEQEIFSQTSLDSKGRVSFKAYSGKFVCADQTANNLLIANRTKRDEWEMFSLAVVSPPNIARKKRKPRK